MKSSGPAKLLFPVFLFFLAGCYDLVGGYRGPLYNWTKKDLLYFDISRRALIFPDTSMNFAHVKISQGKKKLFDDEPSSIKRNTFLVPDSVVSLIVNQRFSLNVSSTTGGTYIFDIYRRDWKERKYIIGYFNRGVYNDREMEREIIKFNQWLNEH